MDAPEEEREREEGGLDSARSHVFIYADVSWSATSSFLSLLSLSLFLVIGQTDIAGPAGGGRERLEGRRRRNEEFWRDDQQREGGKRGVD